MADHEEFKRGYIAGYQSATGRNTIPSIPATPSMGGKKPYDVGYQRGLAAGK